MNIARKIVDALSTDHDVVIEVGAGMGVLTQYLIENQLNRKEEAMECYSRLFDYYTASVYVAQARKSYRRLRDELK